VPWSTGTMDQRKFDGSRALRQVPAITELSQLDSTGEEQLRQSKLAMDVQNSHIDFSYEAKFAEAVAKKVSFGQKIHLTAFSCGLLMIITQEPDQSLAAFDAPLTIEALVPRYWFDEDCHRGQIYSMLNYGTGL
jgi:hypothetical protein